jgi:hypothetical protein
MDKARKGNKGKSLNIGDKVGASLGYTLSIGDYQSVRIDAWAETSVLKSETGTNAFRRIFEFIEKKLNIEAEPYIKSAQNQKNKTRR